MILNNTLKILIYIFFIITPSFSLSMKREYKTEPREIILENEISLPEDFIKNDFYFIIDEEFRQSILEFIEILSSRITIKEISECLQIMVDQKVTFKKIISLFEEAFSPYRQWSTLFLDDLRQGNARNAVQRLPALLKKIDKNPSNTSGLIIKLLMYKKLSIDLNDHTKEKATYIFNATAHATVLSNSIRLFIILLFTSIYNKDRICMEQISALLCFLPFYAVILYGLNGIYEHQSLKHMKTIIKNKLEKIEDMLINL